MKNRCIIYETSAGIQGFEVTDKSVEEWKSLNPALRYIFSFSLASGGAMKKQLAERQGHSCKVSSLCGIV